MKRRKVCPLRSLQGMSFSSSTCKTRRSHLEHMARRMHRGPWSIGADDIAGYFAEHNWEQETRRSRRNTIAAFYAWAVQTGRTDFDTLLNPGMSDSELSDIGTQLVYSYKIDPRTVFYAGYSDSYVGGDSVDSFQTGRSLFLKLAYAWQP